MGGRGTSPIGGERMSEDLPLPPEVRATQADALRPLEQHWPCDAADNGHRCQLPGRFGSRSACCHLALLLCPIHFARVFAALTDAKNHDHGVRCPTCNHHTPAPIRASDVLDVCLDLYIAGPAFGDTE
jgi:hypothetical protein